MPQKNDEFIDALHRANPIETVIGSYVQLKKRGKNYLCSCPFHSEKTPSCTVFPDTQTFHCFGCGAGGDVITFVMQIENLNFIEAARLLAQRSGIEMPAYSGNSQNSQRRTRIYEMNRIAANFFYLNLVNGQNKSGLKYFYDRRISPQTIKKYGLGYAPDSWDTIIKLLHSKGYSDEEIIDSWLGGRSQKTGNMFDMFRNRVIFPIIDLRKNVIGFGGRVLDDSKPKYLNTAKTPIFDKGSNLFSLNFAKSSDSKKMILCEGYMDVIAVNQAGFENVVATLGTAITPAQARLISHYAEEVIIAYDSDSAGQTAARKAINHFSDVGVRATVIHMEGAKDPDEFIKKFGCDRFRMLLDNSRDANDFMLDKCENGLDLDTEAGKIELLKRASSVLAGISSPIEREIYISRTSKKGGIPVDVLKAHIDAILSKSRKQEKNKIWNSMVSGMTRRNDKINPEAVTSSKEANAEEQIIYFLLRHSEECNEIQKLILPECFMTSFNRKVYSAILEHIKNNEQFSVSMLTGEFSPEEWGRISGILAKYENANINMQVVSDCAGVLKKASSSGSNGDISLDELANMFKGKIQ